MHSECVWGCVWGCDSWQCIFKQPVNRTKNNTRECVDYANTRLRAKFVYFGSYSRPCTFHLVFFSLVAGVWNCRILRQPHYSLLKSKDRWCVFISGYWRTRMLQMLGLGWQQRAVELSAKIRANTSNAHGQPVWRGAALYWLWDHRVLLPCESGEPGQICCCFLSLRRKRRWTWRASPRFLSAETKFWSHKDCSWYKYLNQHF